MSDDISGNGAVIIDGAEAATVYYWLTISLKVGPPIAEGSISGVRRAGVKDQERQRLRSACLKMI
jgi:hypothetical protein